MLYALNKNCAANCMRSFSSFRGRCTVMLDDFLTNCFSFAVDWCLLQSFQYYCITI